MRGEQILEVEVGGDGEMRGKKMNKGTDKEVEEEID